jgi:formate hydrogenlyase transcriptional activator
MSAPFYALRSSTEDKLVGASEKLQDVMEQAAIVGPTDATTLILGETGTGKGRIASAIHEMSSRRNHQFVKLNCAAIPLGLLESELFGHERGAFTGAIAQRFGRFETANRGTLFLDEIGDIPGELQPKLLRVLQEHEFERLGSTHTIRTDVRLIAATHYDLRRMIRKGKFRSDLFYRLNVFPITVPPLRERSEDIPLPVKHFVSAFSRRLNRGVEVIPKGMIDAFCRYPWPGNIRELENFIERAVIPVTRVPILRTLRASKGVIAAAAVRLAVPRSTLFYKMRRLGIGVPSKEKHHPPAPAVTTQGERCLEATSASSGESHGYNPAGG